MDESGLCSTCWGGAHLMERTRAAVCLVNAQGTPRNQERMKLEAFMGLFHPKLQRDRNYMRELHRACRSD